MKKIILSLFCVLFLLPLYSQDKIQRLSYTIADTSATKTEQAAALYEWITRNISYDTQKLRKEEKNNTPEQTLRQKKAVCYGYSELFRRMCEDLDIECYTVKGYCKGIGYVRGDPFTKSNHAWNMVYADSNWIIVDATWGSGGLDHAYDLKTKALNTIRKKKGIKKKLVFVKSPNADYFNRPPDKMAETHFPIDAKWQLMSYPVTFAGFLSDSSQVGPFLSYQKEIDAVRFRETGYQSFIDAINSPRYNPYNSFDKAFAYYDQANQLQIRRKPVLDSLLLIQTDRALRAYDSCLAALGDYKNITRSIYKTKKTDQKNSYKLASRSIKNIDKIPTTANTRFYKVTSKPLKLNALIHRDEVAVSMARLKLEEQNDFSFDSVSGNDTVRFNEYTARIAAGLQSADGYLKELEALKNKIGQLYDSGTAQSDSILSRLHQVNDQLMGIGNAIDGMDEYKTFSGCDALNNAYLSYERALIPKSLLRDVIEPSYFKFDTRFQGTEQKLLSLLQSYERLAKLTGENALYAGSRDSVFLRLESLYDLKLETLRVMKLHNDSWMDLYNLQNKILSPWGSGGIMAINSRLGTYYNYTADRYSNAYSRDLKKYEEIRSHAKKRKKLLKEIRVRIRENLKSGQNS